MPFYPGTEPPSIQQAFTVAEHGYLEQRLTLLSHTGTHLDAPAHMLPAGKSLDAYPVGHFLGQATVADISQAAGRMVSRQALEARIKEFADLDYVLLHTGWAEHWGADSYYSGFPALTAEAAAWLAGCGLRGIGVDAVSVDAAGSTAFPVHHTLLGGGLVIVENLCGLKQLIGLEFRFCCLPLKIADADGAPVRAIALLD